MAEWTDGEYVGRFPSLDALAMSLSVEERVEIAKMLKYAAERDDHNWAASHPQHVIDHRETSLLEAWLEDQFRLVKVSSTEIDAYRWD